MYNVVFEYIEQGTRRWSSFSSKEEFNKSRDAEDQKKRTVVAEGISREECVNLCKETPVMKRVVAAIDRSTDHETGRLRHGELGTSLFSLFWSMSHLQKNS